MHMIFPLAIRASEVLGIDAELRSAWREIKEHLVPVPPGSRCGTRSEIADDRPYGAFVYNGPGAIGPAGSEPELKRRFLGFTRLGSFIDPEGIGGAKIFRNRLRLREGPGAIDAEHIAGLSSGIHETMLSSRPDSLTNQEPISVFNRWPRDWDAAFTCWPAEGFSSAPRRRAARSLWSRSSRSSVALAASPVPGAQARRSIAITSRARIFPAKRCPSRLPGARES